MGSESIRELGGREGSLLAFNLEIGAPKPGPGRITPVQAGSNPADPHGRKPLQPLVSEYWFLGEQKSEGEFRRCHRVE